MAPAHCYVTAELIRRRLCFDTFNAWKGKRGTTECVTPGSGKPEVGLDWFIPQGWGSGGPGGGEKRRWRILAITLNLITILLDSRDTEKGKGVSFPFLPSSLFSALAMTEAGAGLSETVTETTVTVTTEPVRKAGGGGGAV